MSTTDHKTQIRVAIITGVFVVVAAFITTFGPNLFGSVSPTPSKINNEDTIKSATIKVWNEYQKLLAQKDELRKTFNEDNYPATAYILSYNNSFINELKLLIDKNKEIDLKLREHIRKHINLSVEYNQFLNYIDLNSSNLDDIEKSNYSSKGNEMKSRLLTLLDDEKLLANILENKFAYSLTIEHIGIGIL